MELQQSLSMFSTSDKVRFLQFLAYCAYVKSEKRNPLATYRIDEKQNWEKKEKKKIKAIPQTHAITANHVSIHLFLDMCFDSPNIKKT